MKELIITLGLLISPIDKDKEPKTCYCTDEKLGTWTAYCSQQKWSCEKCCEYTKSYLENKNKENE